MRQPCGQLIAVRKKGECVCYVCMRGCLKVCVCVVRVCVCVCATSETAPWYQMTRWRPCLGGLRFQRSDIWETCIPPILHPNPHPPPNHTLSKTTNISHRRLMSDRENQQENNTLQQADVGHKNPFHRREVSPG